MTEAGSSEAPLHVVHVLHGFGTGGLEKGVATIVRHTAPELRHTIVCLDRAGASTRLLPDGTDVVELRKPPGNSPRFLWRLGRTLAGLAPDVVHSRNWGGIDAVLATGLARVAPVVHGEHGFDVGDPDGTDAKRLLIRRIAARLVREYTCVSEDMARWLTDVVGVSRPVTAIVNGVDVERCRPVDDRKELRSRLGLPVDAPLISIVGRLDPIKDHSTLFRAFVGVREGLPSAQLLVVGDGPERERLVAEAPAGVTFLGERADVPELLAASDVFTLTSRNEGTSNTVLEALACGVPVVATAVGGTPALLTDGVEGRLVSPGHDDGIAEALLGYLRDPALAARHGEAARARAVRDFSVARMVDAYVEVYRRVAGTVSRRGSDGARD